MQSDCLGLIVVHSTEHSLRGHSDRVCSDTVTVLKCPKDQQYQERPHIIEERGAAKVAEYARVLMAVLIAVTLTPYRSL